MSDEYEDVWDDEPDADDDDVTQALLDDMREIEALALEGSGDALGGMEYLAQIAAIAAKWNNAP